MSVLVRARGAGALLALALLAPSPPHSQFAQSGRAPAQTELTSERQPEPAGHSARGVELYRLGKAREASDELRRVVKERGEDAEAWHYLGLALKDAGKIEDARRASERAADLRLGALIKELNEQRERDGDGADRRELDARRARFAARVKEAVESVERYVESRPDDEALWRGQLETLRLYEKVADDPAYATTPFRVAARIRKAIVTSKPPPAYTERARRNGTSGDIVVRVLLGAGGEVEGVRVLKSLGDGLDEQAVDAARRIKFTPAAVDGRPVSQLVKVEYNFRVH